MWARAALAAAIVATNGAAHQSMDGLVNGE
jgi:hypothetical protein